MAALAIANSKLDEFSFLQIFEKWCLKTPFSPEKSSFKAEDKLQMPTQHNMYILRQISHILGTNFAQIQVKMPIQMNFKVLRLLFFFFK